MRIKVQLLLTVIGTAIEMLFAGAIYGWPSLQPVLISVGYFSEGCQSENITKNNNTTTECKSQIEQLNLVFTVVTSLPPVIAIGFGYILDRYGTWVTRTIILLMLFAGIELTAWTTPDHSWVLLISLSLCNLAGYGLLFANLTIGNLVPYYRASIVTIMCGAFDSATSVFLLFRYLYEMGVSFRMMFQVYACIVLIFMVQTFLLTPMRTAPCILPEGYVYGYRELGCCRSPEKEEDPVYNEVRKEEEEIADHPDDNPDSQTFKECIKEVYTWTEVLHYCIIHFTVTSFIGNFNNWITTKVEPEQIGFYTSAFGSIQSLGIFFAPFSGLLIDYCRRRFSKSLGLMLGSFKSVTVLLFINDFLLITMLLLSLMPSAEVQFVTMILQVVSSACVYSTVAAFASAVYPTQHFGVLYSCTEAIGGLFLLLQYPVTLLLTRVLDNNFALVNGVLLGLCCVNLLHPCYLLRIIARRARKRELRMEKLRESSTAMNNRQDVDVK